MKIKRFNESLTEKWNPTDKVLKVHMKYDFEINIDTLRKSPSFIEHCKEYPGSPDDWESEDLEYVIQEWVWLEGEPTIEYQLYDGLGNKIDDEQKFDTVNKYNL